MKKTISLMLCLLLIFSSVSFAFAIDWSTTDSNNLQSIKNAVNNGGGLYNLINSIEDSLWYVDGNTSRSIAWWVKEAVLDLDQLVGNGNGTVLNYLDNIYQRLVDIKNSTANIYTETHTIRTNVADLMENYMPAIRNAITLYLPQIKTDTANIFSYMANLSGNKTVTWMRYQNGTLTFENKNLGFFDFITSMHNYGILPFANMVLGEFNQSNGNYNSSQSFTNWATLNSSSFTPTSSTDGLYKWLSNIQTPIARLAYVHASDEEIAAREKAAANQDAVVDNFIDSTGSGAAPASSFGSVASMSSGYTSNMNTDASATGIWNIFNSNNFGWFSQETANQLDTTVSTRKGSSDFETPLLNQQISDIYKELGVDVND